MKTSLSKEFEKRINKNATLAQISSIVLKNYSLGTFVSNKVLYLGYGDFSYILKTNQGKYLVKIINKETKTADCQSIVDRYFYSSQNKKINCPMVHKTNDDKTLFTFKIGKTEYRLFVMQYIKGVDLYSSCHQITLSDIKQIAEQMAYIHQTDFKPKFIYDSWAIESFQKEWNKFNKSLLSNEMVEKINHYNSMFENCNFSLLPQCFNHGDIVDMNIMKSDGKLYIVDFSSANYQTRISDLCVTIADMLLFFDDFEKTKTYILQFLKSYQEVLPLTDQEKRNLHLFVIISILIGYLNAKKSKTKSQYNTMLQTKYLNNLKLAESEDFKQLFKLI